MLWSSESRIAVRVVEVFTVNNLLKSLLDQLLSACLGQCLTSGGGSRPRMSSSYTHIWLYNEKSTHARLGVPCKLYTSRSCATTRALNPTPFLYFCPFSCPLFPPFAPFTEEYLVNISPWMENILLRQCSKC